MILPWTQPLEFQEVAATTDDFFSTSFVVFATVLKLGNFWIMCFPSANFTTFPDVLKKIHQILDINKKIGGKINLATTLFHS